MGFMILCLLHVTSFQLPKDYENPTYWIAFLAIGILILLVILCKSQCIYCAVVESIDVNHDEWMDQEVEIMPKRAVTIAEHKKYTEITTDY